MLKNVLRGLVDLLAPACCAACDLPLVGSFSGFCEACEPLIDKAAWDAGSEDGAACIYGGPLAEAIAHLKYGGRSDLAPVLARPLVACAKLRFVGQVDEVCCVPLHPPRLRARGFNQSALLAAPVAHALGAHFRPARLARTRETPQQAGLDRAARQRNLYGAFRVRGKVAGRRVLIVDDVVTTHATFSELRRVLQAEGAEAVYTLALARTERDDAGDAEGHALSG